jgi:serine/threonine protein kinase
VSVCSLTSTEVEELCREIQVLEGLRHPNIVKIVAAWLSQENDEVVLISEVVSGGPLTAYLRKIQAPLRRVVRQWCRDILEALAYLHSRGVLHRDLKVENIHIDSNTGDALLCNLGFSSVVMSSNAEYLAPEVYDQEYDTSADIYALGIAVLEMCSRSQPYEECSNPAAIYHRLLSGVKPKSLSRIQDAEVKSFISVCLASVEDRPQAAELLSHAFLCQQENELDGAAVAISAVGGVPIELSILNGAKIHHIEFELALGEKPEDLAQQVVSELKLDKSYIDQVTNQIKAQLGNEPTSPSSNPLKQAKLERVESTASLIDMDDYIEANHTPVSLVIMGSNSPVRVEFEYSLTFDRPVSVARELVHELNLPPGSVPSLTDQIKEAVGSNPNMRHTGSQTQSPSYIAAFALKDLSFDKFAKKGSFIE